MDETMRFFSNDLDKFRDYIYDNELRIAFRFLYTKILPLCTQFSVYEEAQTLCESYQILLESTLRLPSDPNRTRILEQMVRWGFEIHEQLKMEWGIKYSEEHIHKLRRQQREHPLPSYTELFQRMQQAQDRRNALHPQCDAEVLKREQAERESLEWLDTIYDKIYASGPWTEEEAAEVNALMHSPDITHNQASVIIAAITIGVLQLFDERKYLTLLQLCQLPDLANSQRALVGVCFFLSRYRKTVSLMPSMWDALKVLAGLPHIQERLQCIQVHFIYSWDARCLSKEEITVDAIRDGMDVSYNLFSELKHYSFFLDAAHWFYLFSTDNNYVRPVAQQLQERHAEGLRLFLESPQICDSDRFSFTFLLQHTDSSQLGLFAQQFEAHIDVLRQYQRFSAHNANDYALVTQQYVSNFNRFFNLWQYCDHILSPIEDDMDLFILPPIQKLAPDLHFHAKLIDMLHGSKCALFPFEVHYDILKSTPLYREEYKKSCILAHIEGGQYEKAITKLNEMLNAGDDPVWAIRRMVRCSRHEKRLNALDVMCRWYAIEPSSLKAKAAYIRELINHRLFQIALPLLHEWTFEDGQSPEPLRQLVWVQLNLGQLKEAKQNSKKVLSQFPPVFDDYVNAAHLSLLAGHIKRALALYRQAIPLFDPSLKTHTYPSRERTFNSIFEELRPLINFNNIAMVTDFTLVKDAVCQEAKEILEKE
jgi:tetratricopeptide (TPR) repeat protein